jgi:hypothetical protein
MIRSTTLSTYTVAISGITSPATFETPKQAAAGLWAILRELPLRRGDRRDLEYFLAGEGAAERAEAFLAGGRLELPFRLGSRRYVARITASSD